MLLCSEVSQGRQREFFVQHLLLAVGMIMPSFDTFSSSIIVNETDLNHEPVRKAGTYSHPTTLLALRS